MTVTPVEQSSEAGATDRCEETMMFLINHSTAFANLLLNKIIGWVYQRQARVPLSKEKLITPSTFNNYATLSSDVHLLCGATPMLVGFNK